MMLDRTRIPTLVCVPPGDVAKVWPGVAQMIDDAYAAVDHLTPDVQTWLIERKGVLWISVLNGEPVGALTTSLEPRRSGVALRMVAAGAAALDFATIHLPAIERYAAAEGCYKVEFSGRQGWGRVSAFTGYVPQTVTFSKRL